MTSIARGPYSYTSDPAVPAFAEAGPIVFMDGECLLCSRTARLIARLDHRGEFRICPIQTPLGRQMLIHYGLDPGAPDSWLYLEDGRAYASLDAVIRAGRRLGGWARIAEIFALLPRAARDWLYARIARNRYALFGRADMCALPDPALRRRLMSGGS
jgi:predicted DCC family thiol-disulfide oxidoreductase YuxK